MTETDDRNTPNRKRRSAPERQEHPLLQQRRLIAEFDNAIYQAYRKDTKPLRKYLHSDAPLSEKQREVLATLIYLRIRVKQKGHPFGPLPFLTEDKEMTEKKRYIVSVVRRKEKDWHKAHPNKNLPRGMRRRLIEQVLGLEAEGGELHGLAEITVEKIHKDIARGMKKRKSKSVPTC